MVGVSERRLALDDGTSVIVGPKTEVDVALAEGIFVEIDALETEFGLTAHEISSGEARLRSMPAYLGGIC